MKLAILFWFYKDFLICRNRIEILRRFNPKMRIFGLFGGNANDAQEAEYQLAGGLDDLYIFDEERDSQWKWRHGDHLIARWHKDRGHQLEWDTVVVVQWDMLILGPISTLFDMLQPGEILLSGLRPASEVRSWWPWLQESNPDTMQDCDKFTAWAQEIFGYSGELLCCLFIVVCLPRRFLHLYVEAGPPEIGFLEYKVPTLARAFEIPFCLGHPFTPWWARDPATQNAPAGNRLLKAVGDDVPEPDIVHAVETEQSWVFHPYGKVWHQPTELPKRQIGRWFSRWRPS